MSSETAPRRLVLARHAQAVDAAATDAVRELSARGRRDAEAAWDQMCAGAGWELAADLDRGLYEAGTDAALDLVRLVPAQVRTLVVVGHNPTIGSLAHVLDDGDGDPEAVTALLGGYPTSALTVFAVSTAWADLAEESATVLAHHVARG